MIFILLVMFVLSICLLINNTNFLLSLLNVFFFFCYSVSYKGSVYYDLSCNKFYIFRNVVFFGNQYFFSIYVEPFFVAPILPNFKDLSSF